MNRAGIRILSAAVALVACAAVAAPPAKKPAKAAAEKGPKVVIEQFPKCGRQSTLAAPAVGGASIVGNCWTGKPRKWIVLEAKYTTEDKWLDQLTFTWHVMLDTKTATAKDKDDRENIPPYSYFTTTVTYYNIPRGSHAASVCLPPSYLERFGEAKAVGVVIADKNGNVVAGDCESEIKGIASHPKDTKAAFWNDQKVMNAEDKTSGEPLVERRQGLLDRSKTIWALVNPNDYETVVQ